MNHLSMDRRAFVLNAALATALGGAAVAGSRMAFAADSAAKDSADSSSKDSSGSASADTTNKSVSVAEGDDTRIVNDSYGNEVRIPATVDRVAPIIGAFSQVTEMLTQGTGKIVAAATNNISDEFKMVFPDYEESNPNGYNARDVENLIAANAQVAYGPSSVFSDEQKVQLEAANIAFVALDSIKTVEGMCTCISIIGEILGESESKVAEQFVDYYKHSISDSAEVVKDLKDDEKPRVIQLGYNGGTYSTTNSSDISHEYFVAAGANNVAADYTGTQSGTSLTLSAENLVEFDPEYIFTRGEEAVTAIKEDPALAEVSAVKNDNIYQVPTGIYLWSVRSGEGAMMTPWLDSILHPDLFPDLNMVAVVQDFFGTYYRYELSEEEAQAILNGEWGA